MVSGDNEKDEQMRKETVLFGCCGFLESEKDVTPEIALSLSDNSRTAVGNINISRKKDPIRGLTGTVNVIKE